MPSRNIQVQHCAPTSCPPPHGYPRSKPVAGSCLEPLTHASDDTSPGAHREQRQAAANHSQHHGHISGWRRGARRRGLVAARPRPGAAQNADAAQAHHDDASTGARSNRSTSLGEHHSATHNQTTIAQYCRHTIAQYCRHRKKDTACRVSNSLLHVSNSPRGAAASFPEPRFGNVFTYLRSPFSTLSPFGCCRCAALQCRRAASAEEGSCPQGGPPPVSPSPSAKLRLAACFRTHQRLAKKKHRLRRRGAQTIQAWLHNRCVLLQAIIQLDASNVRQLMNKQFGWSLT